MSDSYCSFSTLSYFFIYLSNHSTHLLSLQNCTISECICQMVSLLSLNESEGWHLRKTNWEGEAVEAVEDNSLTIDQEGIKVSNYDPVFIHSLSLLLNIRDN